jgi:chloride channel protein, CIC family
MNAFLESLSAAIAPPLRQLLQAKRLAILEACLIGLVSGLAAVLLQVGIALLGSWRLELSQLAAPYLVLPLIGMVGGGLAGLVLNTLAPEAKGSGIPQVKIALAQLPMPLNWRVAIAKLISSTLALGSGIMLGRQGPTVQLGAALAAQLSYWVPTVPDHRRQMIAAGAGAGLAAGFNAPIAGVIFIVEELLQDLSGLTLGTAIIASFVASVVARVLGGQSFSLNIAQLVTDSGFSVLEIPFYMLLGALAGVLGGLLNHGLMAGAAVGRRTLKLGLPLRIALAGGVCGLVVGCLPPIFQNNAGLRDFITTGSVPWQWVTVAFVVQFGLTILSFASDAPGGVFAPSLVLGSALGHLIGVFQAKFLGVGAIDTYSLVGMGAFFGAVSRVPMTGIVIIFEMTTDFNLVLPLMISGVIANLVAERVSPGSIYDRILLTQGLDLSEIKPMSQGILDALSAKEMMQSQVETLEASLPLLEVRNAFAQSHHRGFPVLDQGRLVGIITQSDVMKLPRDQWDEQTPLQELMTPYPLTVVPSASLTEVLYLLNRYDLSRLPVVDGRKLVGIITRADIIRAESRHLEQSEIRLNRPSAPAYRIYQTQDPATGSGRILVPLANPQTADVLLRLAFAIARDRNYEVECLHVIRVPGHGPLAEASVNAQQAQGLLQAAVQQGHRQGLSVHTQIQAAHDLAKAILETASERHVDLILMGWEGRPARSDWIFGTVVDTVIRQAQGDVLLVKPARTAPIPRFNRWLVPISGGPNARRALELMPTLVQLGTTQPIIEVCQVFVGDQQQPTQFDLKLLKQAIARLTDRCQSDGRKPVGDHGRKPVGDHGRKPVGDHGRKPVGDHGPSLMHDERPNLRRDRRNKGEGLPVEIKSCALCANNVADAVLDLATASATDVIVVGVSRESLLQQVINGNIPERIARESQSTVILVRGGNTGVLH